MTNPGSNGFYVGIDAGSVSLNAVVINQQEEILLEYPYQRHFGRIEECLLDLLRNLYRRFGGQTIASVSFTGNHGKKLSEKLNCYYEFETISQVLGTIAVKADAKTIISMGGQETALFQINHAGDEWELEYFNTNGPCASGTGSFIDQQAQRLATSLYAKEVDLSQDQIDGILADFIELGARSGKPANVACRCTVFTKSDMIHLQNKGEKLEDIIYGLHFGNARNYISTIVSNRRLAEPIVFVGGVSLNKLQIQAFKEYFPGLEVSPHSTALGALGVALQALRAQDHTTVSLADLTEVGYGEGISVPVARRLALRETRFQENNTLQKKNLTKNRRVRTYLGIDIGSTTTKYALINADRQIIHKNYVPTRGKPVEVTQRLLEFIRHDLAAEIDILGTATTGSGRNVVGDFLNADLIIDEITAHARGAVEIDAEVDTIFEIGGQDSKYISINNTYPLDFDMNKVCAAGTGSFLHELANKYGINIVDEFQEIALSSESPVKLAERCTVFMESDLVFYFQKGAVQRDLIAGLCYAIVHNYLNRVVGKRNIGRKVMFLGGPSLNKGVVAAFENVLGHGVAVPAHREVLGAYGAALSVQEKMHPARKIQSSFRGLDNAITDTMSYTEKICRADPNCHNQCKLKIYDFDGRRSIWGGECGRYEITRNHGRKQENFFSVRQQIWQRFMGGLYAELQDEPLLKVDGRPTVGMQRSLYGLQTTVFWAHFFDRLGYRLVLSPPTNTKISRDGVETVVAETCYPVKISHGHVKMLMGKTRFLFLPSMINMPTATTTEVGFYCPMVQSNAYMLRTALGLDRSSTLSPAVHLKYNPDILTVEIAEQMGGKLGLRKSQIKKAVDQGLEKQADFVSEMQQKGRQILEDQSPEEPLVVVTGRPYNLYDNRVNLRLGENLAKIGVKAIPMDFVDVSAVDLSDFPSMYWGLGARVLRTAKFVRQSPNFFGLHLTNFECGPDSFIEHFFKHVMGNKAYLILELDEHSAVAGVMTRLEAYKNVIENSMQKAVSDEATEQKIAN